MFPGGVATAAVAAGMLMMCIQPSQAQVYLENVTAGCFPGGCSGNGECVNSVCICNDLWSSKADFILVEDCTLSHIAMYIMWGVVLLICLFVLYKTAWVIVARFENFFEQKKTIRGYTIMKNPGLISVICIYSLGIPSVMMMAVLHFVDPTIRVGFDTFATVLFFTGKLGLYTGAMFLQGPLLAVALKGEAAFEGLVKFNFRYNMMVNILAIVAGAIPFLTLVNFQTSIPQQFEVIRAYYYSQALTLAMQFVESYLVKLRLNYVLKRANNLMSSEKTSSILMKVNAVQDTITRQAFVQCVLNFVMGSVPFLLNKHNYFLPISWIAIPVIAKTVALQIELDKSGTKTIRQRFRQLLAGTSQTSNENPGSNGPLSSPPKVLSSPTSGKVMDGGVSLVPSSFANLESRNPVAVKPATSQVSSVVGMEELLTGSEVDEETRKKFADFIRSHYASDSLHFYDDVVAYEVCPAKQRLAKATAIMKRFIIDGAPEAIDLPHEVRSALLTAFKEQSYHPDTFARAKQISFNLLKSNFYHKFKNANDDVF